MSLAMSCSCKLMVCVEITTLRRAPPSPCPADRGNEIGETLASPGPRFNDQMLLVADRLFHGASHLQLLRPRFVASQPPRDLTAFTEHLSTVEGHQAASPLLVDSPHGGYADVVALRTRGIESLDCSYERLHHFVSRRAF
jgi:hypothetical protein